MSEKKKRIVVRIEITTLSDRDGKLNKKKLDRLAMVLSNLQNSGKHLIIISSGAISLGKEKLNLEKPLKTFVENQAIAAIGQVELIKSYQKYFDEYNQIIAQVLLPSDIINNKIRVRNTRNTFETLLKMNIIPIVNENDAVSTTDIELDDNYPLALNVAKMVNADIILIKLDANGKYLIIPRGFNRAIMADNEYALFEKIKDLCDANSFGVESDFDYPSSVDKIIF